MYSLIKTWPEVCIEAWCENILKSTLMKTGWGFYSQKAPHTKKVYLSLAEFSNDKTTISLLSGRIDQSSFSYMALDPMSLAVS